jgi:hypothetical protein
MSFNKKDYFIPQDEDFETNEESSDEIEHQPHVMTLDDILNLYLKIKRLCYESYSPIFYRLTSTDLLVFLSRYIPIEED